MRLALGMMVHNDSHWLRLHLPVYVCYLDGIVMVVETERERQDCLNCLASFINLKLIDVSVIVRDFHNSWSEMYNHVINHAERERYDAILRLDPDEAIFERDVIAVRTLLNRYSILCFPRYNFWQDRLHYTPGIYPDWQARAWVLHKGIRLGGQHHEGIGWLQYNMFEGDPIADTPRQVLRVPHLHIYHYGNVGRERILERDLHYLNVEREKAGHPSLTERPTEREFPTRHSIPFAGDQPIDPLDAGIYAPFEE